MAVDLLLTAVRSDLNYVGAELPKIGHDRWVSWE